MHLQCREQKSIMPKPGVTWMGCTRVHTMYTCTYNVRISEPALTYIAYTMYMYIYIHVHVDVCSVLTTQVHTLTVAFCLQFYLRSWSQELQVPVVSIDYSLSPEAPFPRPLDECTMAYAWILQNLPSLGVDVSHCCLFSTYMYIHV